MLESCTKAMRQMGGFTMIELVTVITMLGILAVVAIPRLDTSVYRSLEFHDRTVAALRYAQKTASSHRRTVCVAFTASTVVLTIDHDRSGACDNQVLNLPGANTNGVQSGDTVTAVFSPVPVGFNFFSDGSASDRSILIADQPAITVVGATGYVQ